MFRRLEPPQAKMSAAKQSGKPKTTEQLLQRTGSSNKSNKIKLSMITVCLQGRYRFLRACTQEIMYCTPSTANWLGPRLCRMEKVQS
jgi:hypothetical protein